jgi:hypothetical protein
LVKVAQNLSTRWDSNPAHRCWRLGTNLLEGTNNKFKVVTIVAYGFGDDEYFFLAIRADFPVFPDEPPISQVL